MWRCTPLSHAAAMLKLSDHSDPDLQRYLKHTYTHRQRFLAFIERLVHRSRWHHVISCIRRRFQKFPHVLLAYPLSVYVGAHQQISKADSGVRASPGYLLPADWRETFWPWHREHPNRWMQPAAHICRQKHTAGGESALTEVRPAFSALTLLLSLISYLGQLRFLCEIYCGVQKSEPC